MKDHNVSKYAAPRSYLRHLVLCAVFCSGSLSATGQTEQPKAPIGVGVSAGARVANPALTERKAADNALMLFAQEKTIDHIITPDSWEDLGSILKRYRQGGQPIDFLVIAAHGNPSDPEIEFREHNLVPFQVDPARLRGFHENARDVAQREIEKEENADLSAIEEAKGKMGDARRKLDHVESLDGVLQPDAVVLMINCYGALTPEHEQFQRNIGRALLSPGGGTMVIPRGLVEVDQIRSRLHKGKIRLTTGFWVALDDFYVDGDWVYLHIKPTSISVTLQSWDDRQPISGAEVVLTSRWRPPIVLPEESGGRHALPTVAPGEYALTVKREGWMPYVQSGLVIDAEAQKSVEIRLLRELQFSVKIGAPTVAYVGEGVNITAQTTPAENSPGFPPHRFVWSVDGARQTWTTSSLPKLMRSAGRYDVAVDLLVFVDGQWRKAAGDACSMTVRDEGYARAQIRIHGPSRIATGETAELLAIVTDSNVPFATVYFTWNVDGRVAGGDNPLSLEGLAPGSHEANAELWMKHQPEPVRIAKATHTVIVESAAAEGPERGDGSANDPSPGSAEEAVLAEFRGLWPKTLEKTFPGDRIVLKAIAEAVGPNQFKCAYEVWSKKPDGSEYCSYRVENVRSIEGMRNDIQVMKQFMGQ